MEFNSEATTIRAILHGSKNTYKVSRFQRPYAWEVSHQIDLLTDIINAMELDPDSSEGGYRETEYYMGSFIFHDLNHEQEIKIVDGQQRLITLTMLLEIIRRHLKLFSTNRKINQDAKKMATYLAKEIKDYLHLYDDGEIIPRVSPYGEAEKEYFYKHILNIRNNGLTINEPDDNVCNNYFEGYNNLVGELEARLDLLKPAIKKVHFLRGIYRQIRESVAVVLKFTDEDRAYNIYSNINSKGLYLTQIDLIKNDFLYKTRNTENVPGLDNHSDLWNEISNNVKRHSTVSLEAFYKYCWYILRPEDIDEYFDGNVNLFEIFKSAYPTEKEGGEIKLFFGKISELSKLLINLISPDKVDQWKSDEWVLSVEKLIFMGKVSNDYITNRYILWLLPIYYQWEISGDIRYKRAFKKAIDFVADTIYVYKIVTINDATEENSIKELERFFDVLFKEFSKYAQIESETDFTSIINRLKNERFSIINNVRNIIIHTIENLEYSKNILKNDVEYIRYVLKRLNEEKNCSIEKLKGSIEHIIEDENKAKHSMRIGNLVYLETIQNENAAKYKQALQNEKVQRLEEEILRYKFTHIYSKSEYPEVKKLITNYLSATFDNQEIRDRSTEIGEGFLEMLK